MTARPGRVSTPSSGAGWRVEHIAPSITGNQRAQVTAAYLWQYRKRLEDHQMECVVNADACANPLFLRTLLDECASLAASTTDRHLAGYLTAQGPSDLYTKILSRLEQDYEISALGSGARRVERDCIVAPRPNRD